MTDQPGSDSRRDDSPTEPYAPTFPDPASEPAPIPADAGASPEGPHTHLLPALLRTGRELPAGVDLPPGFAPAAAFHP